MCLGVPGKIVDIYRTNDLLMGKIDFGGVTREACLEYVPEAKIGDYTLIHVGFALNLISEEEAQETLEMLRAIAQTVGDDQLEVLDPKQDPARAS